MNMINTVSERAGTLISPDGSSVAITIIDHQMRVIGHDNDSLPVTLMEVDFLADWQLAVPELAMIEMPGGQTIELKVVFGLPLDGDRHYFKAIGLKEVS